MGKTGFFSLALLALSSALPLPHPEYNVEFQEEVRAFRQDNGLVVGGGDHHLRNYVPHHCLFINATECRQLMEGTEKRKLVNFGEGIRVLVLLCRFTDHADRDLPDPSYFEELFNGEGSSNVNPVGSIREWLNINSLGKYDGTRTCLLCSSLQVSFLPAVTFDVQTRWRTTSNTEAHFAGGRFGLRGATAIQELFSPLLEELDSEGYDWSTLDVDGWGELDHLVIMNF